MIPEVPRTQGTRVQSRCDRSGNGAGYRIRTRGPLITNQVLYQLS